MSGIYISGVEIPKDNTVLLRIYPESEGVFYVEQLDIDDDILDKYWAVPVPEHGRLIDADALELERMAENAKKGWHDSFAVVFNGDPYYEAAYDCTEQFKELVNNAPTIIPVDPAEEEEG